MKKRFVIMVIVSTFMGFFPVSNRGVSVVHAAETYTFIFKNMNFDYLKEVEADLRMRGGGGFYPLGRKYEWGLSVKQGMTYTLKATCNGCSPAGPFRVEYFEIMAATGNGSQFKRYTKIFNGTPGKTTYNVDLSKEGGELKFNCY